MHQNSLSAGALPQTSLGELTVTPDSCLYLRGLLLRGWRETGQGKEKVKGKEGERWREGFGPPKNFGVAAPMVQNVVLLFYISQLGLFSDETPCK